MIDGILLIDKEKNITSYDVIRKLKRILPRGQKIGQKLLSEIIFLAKSEGKSIDPKCSFVKKELNNDSEHKNLIYQKNTKEEKNSENSK